MTNRKNGGRTPAVVICGLFAAVTVLCAMMTIPLGFTPVPINLATLAVFLGGALLGKKYGTISILVYIALGAAGLPVFAGFKGGLGVLAGPTGGYIIGYIPAVFVTGLICWKFHRQGETYARSFITDIIAMIAGLLFCYLLGTIWFMHLTGTAAGAALLACVVPFLPGDAVKILIAAFLAGRLRKPLNEYMPEG